MLGISVWVIKFKVVCSHMSCLPLRSLLAVLFTIICSLLTVLHDHL